MHELVSTTRMLADPRQFYAFDWSGDACEPLPNGSEECCRRDWARNHHAIHYYTVGRFRDFRLDLYRAPGPVELNAAQ